MSLIAKIIALLKRAGIDYSKMAGKVDPGKISQLITKTQKTATKPKLIDALNKEKATFTDALKIFEDESKYLSQMNEMELVNFANNLEDFFVASSIACFLVLSIIFKYFVTSFSLLIKVSKFSNGRPAALKVSAISDALASACILLAIEVSPSPGLVGLTRSFLATAFINSIPAFTAISNKSVF